MFVSNNQRLTEGFGVNAYKLATKILIFAKSIYIITGYKRVYILKKTCELLHFLIFTGKSKVLLTQWLIRS